MDITDNIFNERPCPEARVWMKSQPDLRTGYEVCLDGGWMWWSLIHSEGNLPPKDVSITFATACAERAKIESSASSAESSAAADAAAGAAYSTALYFAYPFPRQMSMSESAVYAPDYVAAKYAADAAYYAAVSAYYDSKKTYFSELQWQADWIREHIPNPF